MEKTNLNRDFKVDLNTTREEDLIIENLLRELISLPRKSRSKDGIDIERLIESFSVSTAKDFFIDLKSLDQQINLNAYLSRLNKSMYDRNINRVVGVVYTLENWRKDKKVLKLPVISKPISWVYFLLFRVLPKIRLLNKLTVISKTGCILMPKYLVGFVIMGLILKILFWQKIIVSFLFCPEKITHRKNPYNMACL